MPVERKVLEMHVTNDIHFQLGFEHKFGVRVLRFLGSKESFIFSFKANSLNIFLSSLINKVRIRFPNITEI